MLTRNPEAGDFLILYHPSGFLFVPGLVYVTRVTETGFFIGSAFALEFSDELRFADYVNVAKYENSEKNRFADIKTDWSFFSTFVEAAYDSLIHPSEDAENRRKILGRHIAAIGKLLQESV